MKITKVYLAFNLLKCILTGPGETLAIAEEEAARAALKHIFGTTENRPPLPLDSTKHAHLNEVVCAEVTSARLTSQASFSS